MLMMTFALLAATASAETSLGVTATVVRPVEIAVASTEAADGIIVVHNTAAVEVQASSASVTQADADTMHVTSDGTGPVTITLVY